MWQRLKPNVGYWWMAWAIPSEKSHNPVRLEETRCLIRHLELVRLEGSRLRYHDQGFVPVTDLGGTKRAGWQDPNHLPARPVAAFHGRAKKAEPKIEPPINQSASLDGSKDVADKPHGILARIFGPSEGQSAVESAEIKNAYLDHVSQLTDGIKVCGWLMLKNGSADQVEIHGPDDHIVVCTVVQRVDISRGYPKLESAIDAGFEAKLVDEKFLRGDRYQFTIVAKQNGQTAFRCQVTCGMGDDNCETAHCIRDGVLNI